MNLKIVVPTLLAVGAITAGCGSDDDGGSTAAEGGGESPSEVVIAAPIELTGPAAAAGTEYLQVLNFAVDRINDDGGIEALGGAKLEIESVDNESDPQRTAQLLRQMHSDGAVVTVGPITSSMLVASKPVLSSLGMPAIFVSQDDSLTEGDHDRTMWRLTAPMSRFAESMLDFVKSAQDAGEIDVSKVGIVTPDIPPGPTLKDELVAGAEAAGWEPTVVEYNFVETRDFSPVVAKLRAADVDVVMGHAISSDALGFGKALELQDWRPSEGFVWGPGYSLHSVREPLGEAADGWIAQSSVAPETSCETANELAADYQEEFGDPLVSLSGSGVSVIAVIADALERAASTDSEAIRDALADTDLSFCEGIYNTAGKATFDESGENVGFEPLFVQYSGKDGQTAIAPADLAASEPRWPALSGK